MTKMYVSCELGIKNDEPSQHVYKDGLLSLFLALTWVAKLLVAGYTFLRL